jgi:hypothetical protein
MSRARWNQSTQQSLNALNVYKKEQQQWSVTGHKRCVELFCSSAAAQCCPTELKIYKN